MGKKSKEAYNEDCKAVVMSAAMLAQHILMYIKSHPEVKEYPLETVAFATEMILDYPGEGDGSAYEEVSKAYRDFLEEAHNTLLRIYNYAKLTGVLPSIKPTGEA